MLLVSAVVVISAASALIASSSSGRRVSRRRAAEGGGAHDLEFSHVEVFVRSLRSRSEYQKLETSMEDFSEALRREKLKLDWYSESESAAAAALYEKQDDFEQTDLVAQLIGGLNWRMVSWKEGEDGERSATVSAPGGLDAATFVITSSERSRRFCDSKRPGVGALAFSCRSVDAVRQAYRETHPELLIQDSLDDVVEAYAYYDEDGKGADKTSAVLRFSEKGAKRECYEHDVSRGAVSDHWVSNVKDRDRFVTTMDDVLGLSAKVEFDAGVISAGAASIESTVVGGDSVYLPVNNALSEFGHVAGYLDQIGQGVQHLASRVDDLVAFVSTARMLRKATGLGFDFLDVPRSYYGRLDRRDLADELFDSLLKEGVVDEAGLVDLYADRGRVLAIVGGDQDLADFVLRQRYSKIYDVLGDRLTEDEYVRVVESRILVDSQGSDALLQIFTKCVLQEDPSHEAPFLEFIQRVCGGAAEETKLGCGGFGIRNFLALFLSIELNSALLQLAQASTKTAQNKALAKVNSLNTQLDLSSPVLQEITRAAAEEAEAATPSQLEIARTKKHAAQTKLQQISKRFADEAKQYNS